MDFATIFDAAPTPFLILNPDLTIAAANHAYLEATDTTLEAIIGCNIFEVFPDNPEDPGSTATRNLRTSLLRVLQNKMPDTMAIQKYDIAVGLPGERRFEERYWTPINTLVFNADGALTHIIHHVADVTDQVHAKSALDKSNLELTGWLERQRTQENRQAFQLELADRLRSLSVDDRSKLNQLEQ